LEPLERRVFARARAPASAYSSAEVFAPPAPADVTLAAEVPACNTPFLTDAQLEQADAMTAGEVRAFLAGRVRL
jgi:hypothetical protein